MKRNTKRGQSDRSGFTLVELLVVLVIIGIMAVILLPNLVGGSDGARLRTASRGITQMARYARTMAILYQTPMTLEISSDGQLSVAPARGSAVVALPPTDPNAEEEHTRKKGSDEDQPFDGGGSYILADAAASKSYAQIGFRVELDENALSVDGEDAYLEQEERQDGDEDAAAMSGEAAMLTRIPFESNGRCLPFVVKVFIGDDERGDVMSVRVDRFGSAKIEGDE